MKKLAIIIILTLVVLITGCEELSFGKKLVKVQGMADILTELNAKTSDVGIMDSVMANYYLSQDSTYANQLMITGEALGEEKYGIATRKTGKYTAAVISNALISLSTDGTITKIATKYGLEDEIIIDDAKSIDLTTVSGKDDYDYITNKGKLIVGYTLFAPIAYKDSNGELIGFDIELAKEVGKYLNIEIEFQIINWNSKEFELEAKTIDCIWNGLTITPEREEAMSITIPYLRNQQVFVIRKEDEAKYKTTADMKNAIIVVEAGSAGEGYVAK